MKKVTDTEKFETCIICGKTTDILISTPIDLRENYEIGLGQICTACAGGRKTSEDMLSTAQILLAVKQSRDKNEKTNGI